MELVTFQSEAVLKELVAHSYLRCDPKLVNVQRYGKVYDWITEHMSQQVESPRGVRYPVWCWVKFKNGICPPRHRGTPGTEPQIKITFTKRREDVFITDYRRYSFLLNYRYIPESLEDKRQFEEMLGQFGLEKNAAIPQAYQDYPEISREIERSFQRCISSNSDVLQGCVWEVSLSDVTKIEFLRDTEYQYGTFNYLRKNGQRFHWIDDFYRRLR